MGKTPCLLPPHVLEKRGGRGLAGGGLGPVVQGARAAGIVGKRGSGMWGIDSPTHLGSGRGEGAGRREWAAVALVARGGGASAREERLEAAEVVAGMAGGSGSLL